MRQASQLGVFGPLTSVVPLPAGQKYVVVELLTKETLYCVVEVKSNVGVVLRKACDYLGLLDAELFGLAVSCDKEFIFLDPRQKLSKLAPKSWKSTHDNGLDVSGKPMLSFHLRVQFYVDYAALLRSKQTRHHYYLQLRENFLNYWQMCSEERAFLLGTYALQADVGNFRGDRHRGRYFRPEEYFPPWILNNFGEDYIINSVPKIHKDYVGLSSGEAQLAFIQQASSSPSLSSSSASCDAQYNLHLYHLKKNKHDGVGSVWLGICTKGIEVLEEGGGSSQSKRSVSSFPWPAIRKLSFEKKKFELAIVSFANLRKFTYYTASEEKSKHLLFLSKATHQFNLIIQPRITELQRLALEGKKNYREAYIYSSQKDFDSELRRVSNGSVRDVGSARKRVVSKDEQRVSVISNVSSNTSGIVSDRVHSRDGSEVEADPKEFLSATCAEEATNPDEPTTTNVASALEWSDPGRLPHCRQYPGSGTSERDRALDESVKPPGLVGLRPRHRHVQQTRTKIGVSSLSRAPQTLHLPQPLPRTRPPTSSSDPERHPVKKSTSFSEPSGQEDEDRSWVPPPPAQQEALVSACRRTRKVSGSVSGDEGYFASADLHPERDGKTEDPVRTRSPDVHLGASFPQAVNVAFLEKSEGPFKSEVQGDPRPSLDLWRLRRKSQELDLPLITALCNDRSLVAGGKPTPKPRLAQHPGRPVSWHEGAKRNGISEAVRAEPPASAVLSTQSDVSASFA